MQTQQPVRLTQYAHGGGCACKIPPGELEEAVARLVPEHRPDDLLIGVEHGDDAAVVRISPTWAVVATADFFTPVVDDPRTFGRIAAANALSDVYAVGGEPLVALNLLGWPRDVLGVDLAAELLSGGLEIAKQAGCHVAGGHSIDDPEPKYGIAVTRLGRPGLVGAARGLQRPVRRGAAAPRRRPDIRRPPYRRGDSRGPGDRRACAARRLCHQRYLTVTVRSSGNGNLGQAGRTVDTTSGRLSWWPTVTAKFELPPDATSGRSRSSNFAAADVRPRGASLVFSSAPRPRPAMNKEDRSVQAQAETGPALGLPRQLPQRPRLGSVHPILAALFFALALTAYLVDQAVHPRGVLTWYDLNVYNDAGLITRQLPSIL